MKDISIYDVLNMDNPVIIDIRDNYSYNMGHIDNALNIPYYSLLGNYKYYLRKDEIYYLYCDYGTKSREISDRLNMFGYNTYYVKEGYLDFKKYIK